MTTEVNVSNTLSHDVLIGVGYTSQHFIRWVTDMNSSTIVETIRDMIVSMDFSSVHSAVEKALDEGVEPKDIIQSALEPGITTIGKMFDDGSIHLPTVVSASNMMDDILILLKERSDDKEDGAYGRVVVIMGTVENDIHEIGKNICVAMLRSSGFYVIDLGCDVPASKFLDAAVKYHSKIVAASAPMSTALCVQKDLVSQAKEIDDPPRILVGGAACTDIWCRTIEADGYSLDWIAFVSLVKETTELIKWK